MMIDFIIFNSSLVPLIEGLCSRSNPCEFEFSDLDGIEPKRPRDYQFIALIN